MSPCLSLQIVTGVLGAIPVVTGSIGMSGLSDPLYAGPGVPSNVLLDSNLRFLSGVWIGLGLAMFWLIQRIETQTILFRFLWAMIFLGGVGRVISMLFLGTPPTMGRAHPTRRMSHNSFLTESNKG